MSFFTADIHDWESWGRVFHDREAFAPLVGEILCREGLPQASLEDVSPGTNGVFRAGEYLVKVFVPRESGMDSTLDYHRELQGMRRAMRLGISTPCIVACGALEDKYYFRYIVEEFIPGADAGDVLGAMPEAERQAFAARLRQDVDAFHTPSFEEAPVDIVARVADNPRWARLPRGLHGELLEHARRMRDAPQVYVHGDITAENLRIAPDGRVYLLDFADCTMAPASYELAPICVDLFKMDKALLRGFFGPDDTRAGMEDLFHGVLLHDYGYDFVRILCRDLLYCEVEELTGFAALRDALMEFLL